MRKYCLVALVISMTLLMAGFVLAGEESRGTFNSSGKTVFTNVAVTGINQNQIPGYIEFQDNTATTPVKFYLWVSSDGKLRISSQTSVNNTAGTLASPSDVAPWGNASGIIVGIQAA